MKVVLSTSPFTPEQSYYYKFPRFPVLNIAVLAAAIEDEHEVRIVSNQDCRDPAHRLDEVMRAFPAQVIGLSAPSSLGGIAVLRLMPELVAKYPGVRFVAGGQHATEHWEIYLASGFDAVVLGQGDHTLRALLRAWETGGEIAEIPGIAHLGPDGVARRTPPPANDWALDSLPLPSRHLLPEHREIYGFGPAAALEMSRGCPFTCNFCTIHQYWGPYREKSTARILEELEDLARQGVRELLVVDHSFALNARHTWDLAREMVAAQFGMRFGAFIRADTIANNPDLMAGLARAGLSYVICGFESYSDAELQWMNKRTTPRHNREAARVLKKLGVVVLGNHIYFSPGGTVRDAVNTFREGVRNSDVFKAGAFAPLEGSPSAGANPGAVLDPATQDCVHVMAENPWRRAMYQAVALGLFAGSLVSPHQWSGLFSRNPEKRVMVRREYEAFARRFAGMMPPL